MQKKEEILENFKTAIKSTVKSISNKDDIEISFGGQDISVENNKLNFIEEMINYCKKRVIVKEPIKSKSKIIDCDFEIKTKLIKYKIFNGKLGK